MTEMEEVEALKRAYAEMILKTAKEAAARVMATELRAQRMEQELNSTKEEAAGMLLRLKKMIDAKTKEAEITSLNQQRKHDVLESQLNEAEGIILDLRAELSEAEEQLYKMNNQKMLTALQIEKNTGGCNMKPTNTSKGFELFTPLINPGPDFISVGRPSVTENSESNVYSSEKNSVLDHIKEPEHFRNGCTQRICAAETSLVHEKFPVEERLNLSNNSTDIEIVNAVGSNSVSEEKDQQTKNGTVSIIRRSLRKRKLKFWDDVMTACGRKGSYQFKKPRHVFPNLPCFRGKVKRCVQYGEERAEDGTKLESLNNAGVSKEIVHTEALPENMELIDVVVKQDKLAAKFELTSASRIECGVEGDTGTKASYLGKYTFKRKLKNNSIVYNRKWKKKSKFCPLKRC